MLGKRLLILLGGCFLMASAAWADDVGYVNCSSHPDETQVFGKPRKTPDTVAAIPCGERFTILVYGFIFSRIQTRDGKIGYIFSSLISVDHSATSVLQPASERIAVPRSNAPQTTAKAAAQASPTAPTQPEPVAVQTAPAQVPPAVSVAAPAATSNVSVTAATVAQANPTTPAQAEPAAVQPTPAQVTPAVSVAAPAATSNVSVTAATVAPANPTTPTQPEAVAVQPTPTPVVPSTPAPPAEPASNVAETVAPSAQPSPAAVAEPQPAPVEPAAPVVRDAGVRTTWERPLPGGRKIALVEFFGGYAFARTQSGGTSTNLNGVLGSFGWNIKPWVQLVGDTSYNVVTVSNTKNVLYGNHFGPRFFRRGRNRWGITPFVEGLVGGSRADTTVSGAGGYKTSQNCFSIKAGGGLDIHPSRHIDIRLFDVDYYRTSFGTNLHQNNYWASTGIVLRFFGGRDE
jgi:hypothetical protein